MSFGRTETAITSSLRDGRQTAFETFEITQLYQEVSAVLDEAASASRSATRTSLTRTEAMQNHVLAAMVLASGAVVMLAIWVARRLSTEVLVPIAALRNAVERLRQGDLTQRARVIRRDELGELAGSFNIMAEAIALSHSELRERAMSDALTGLLHRSAFEALLSNALESSEHPVAVLFLDLDDFKKVNDTLGHDAGDEVLRAVAGRVRNVLRPGDVASRLGGDEFAVCSRESPSQRPMPSPNAWRPHSLSLYKRLNARFRSAQALGCP